MIVMSDESRVIEQKCVAIVARRLRTQHSSLFFSVQLRLQPPERGGCLGKV